MDGPFEGIDPSIVLNELSLLPAADLPTGKQFYKSYGSNWDALSTRQKIKTVHYFTTLTDSVKERLLEKCKVTNKFHTRG